MLALFMSKAAYLDYAYVEHLKLIYLRQDDNVLNVFIALKQLQRRLLYKKLNWRDFYVDKIAEQRKRLLMSDISMQVRLPCHCFFSCAFVDCRVFD